MNRKELDKLKDVMSDFYSRDMSLAIYEKKVIVFIDQLINDTYEECAKIADWDEKLFEAWWNKMSKNSNKDELVEKRLAQNVWIAATYYTAKAIRDKKCVE